MDFNTTEAVKYHYDKFHPQNINYSNFIQEILKATDALARFDQMLKNLHNNEILLAPPSTTKNRTTARCTGKRYRRRLRCGRSRSP